MSTTAWVVLSIAGYVVFAIGLYTLMKTAHREDHGARKTERDQFHTDVTVTKTGTGDER